MAMKRGERRAAKRQFLRAFARCPISISVCREMKLPRSTVYQWLQDDKRFSEKYRGLSAVYWEPHLIEPKYWTHDDDRDFWQPYWDEYYASQKLGYQLLKYFKIDESEGREAMRRWKEQRYAKVRSNKQQPAPESLPLQGQQGLHIDTIAIVPDAQIAQWPAQPSPMDHLAAMQRRLSLAGRRLVPGAPAGVRKVKVPGGFTGDGSILWRDV